MGKTKGTHKKRNKKISVRLCVKCRICVPLTHFLSRDDGVCDGHKTEKQGGCRFARCGACKRLPSEGMCECEHSCECFACWEYNDNIDRAAMSQGCHTSICWICFENESDLWTQCDCKWLCACEDCVTSRNDSNQGCHRGDCSTCGGCAGQMEPSCDCENTCQCFECREDREEYQTYLLSLESTQPTYEQNEGCLFSACNLCSGSVKKCSEVGCNWLCKCRHCRHARDQELQDQKERRRS